MHCSCFQRNTNEGHILILYWKYFRKSVLSNEIFIGFKIFIIYGDGKLFIKTVMKNSHIRLRQKDRYILIQF